MKASWQKIKVTSLVVMSVVLGITLIVPLLGFEFWFNNKYEEVVLFEFVLFSVALSAQWRFIVVQILSAVLLLMLSLLVWGWNFSVPHFMGKTDRHVYPFGAYEVSYRMEGRGKPIKQHYFALKRVYFWSLIKREVEEIELATPAPPVFPSGPCEIIFPKYRFAVNVCTNKQIDIQP